MPKGGNMYPPGVKPGPNRTKAKRLDDRTKIIRLMKKGVSQVVIAERLGLTQPTVSNDYRAILKELKEVRLNDAEDVVESVLLQNDEVKRQAWKSWIRSVDNEAPDSKYLEIIHKCLDKEIDLRGAAPVKRVELNGNINLWGMIQGVIEEVEGGGNMQDEVKTEIEKMLGVVEAVGASEIIEVKVEEIERG